MKRFWASWWSDKPLNMETPFTWWDTGFRFVAPHSSYVAVIDADSEDSLWHLVTQYFPDNERRFISEKPTGWLPASDRFR